MSGKSAFELEILLDRRRRLILTVDALQRYEKRTGKAPFSSPAWLDDFSDVCALVWALAAEDDPNVTFEEIRPFVDLGVLRTVADAFRQNASKLGTPLLTFMNN